MTAHPAAELPISMDTARHDRTLPGQLTPMKLRELYHRDKCVLSFELFPPKTDLGMGELMKAVTELARYQPDYFTCTYGAGGSTQQRTLAIASDIRKQFQISVASHLTCVGSTVDQLRNYLGSAAEGIDYIVAARDPARTPSSDPSRAVCSMPANW